MPQKFGGNMKRLLLTSAGFLNPKIGQKFLNLTGKPASEIKIIFVPTASKTEKENYYVEESKQELIDLGIKKENIRVLDIDRKIAYSEIAEFDAMYVCGGNMFYLLAKVREFDFGKIIRQFVETGKIYVGVSAGSMFVCPDIELASPFDPNDVGIMDFSGLNLTDIIVSPHYKESDKKIIEEFTKKLRYEIIPLTDNQALLILDKKTEVVE